MNWQDVQIRRGVRQRTAVHEPPSVLSLLAIEDEELLVTWVRKDSESRSREALVKEAGASNIERADALTEWLLCEGWITRKEKLQGGTWQWDGLIWRNLERLKSLLGVSSRTQRSEARASRLAQANAWLEALEPETHLELYESLARAIQHLETESAQRVDVLSTRLDLINSLVEWRRAQMNGTRRDFALYAGEHTKSIGTGEWKWLEKFFDLESLGVSHFLPTIWLAGDAQLLWGERVMDLSPLRFLAIPVEDLLQVSAVKVSHDFWWLIENRASFERQSGRRAPDTFMVWLPGRPALNWLKAIEHLVRLAPAPLRVSADADPAGIDIARTVGSLWRSHGLVWEPYRMGLEEWKVVSQKWPLNDYDVALLQQLLRDINLPDQMKELGKAMLVEGRKAEQEGWL